VDLSTNATEMSLEKDSSSDENPKNNFGKKIRLNYIED
jgi:hypothetical protein